MSKNTASGMTMSADIEAMLQAVKARISDVPVGKTFIDLITDQEWLDGNVDSWMINSGSSENGEPDELDASDKETVKVA